MKVVRVRQHVNPLSQKYQGPVGTPDWKQVYARPTQPLHLDIGCARGKFLLSMAQLKPDWNFLGVEIRQPLVERANQERDRLQLTNLHYLFCNINTSLAMLLSSGCLQAVTIQFPDPWFKRRHQKRRVVQPQLVADLALCLEPGGFLLIQSDVLAVAVDMCDRILAHPEFILKGSPDQWLLENPLPVPTERERSTLKQGKAVYRAWFWRR